MLFLRQFFFVAIASAGLHHEALAASSKAHRKVSPSVPSASATASPQVAPTVPPVWEFALKPEDSVFAIVTRKKGVASAFAHNHFIAARQFDAKLKADPSQLNKGEFQFKTKAADLEVDRSDLQKRWFPVVQSMGWLAQPFESLSDSNRETIRENMLDEGQLNERKFPEITARVEKISDTPATVGEKKFSKQATVAITIRGATVTREFATNLTLQGQELLAEAAGTLKFSDFGITPYSAMMGAVGNEDTFALLVNFRAVKK
ncbi:MAG: hypothetical protein RIR26_1137 [Pseudomonadota bacterium]